jgi:hypothetical protein
MNKPISSAAGGGSLRQRLIDDMNVRRFSPETQRNYIRDVGRFATFVGRPPDTATAEDLRRFQVEQREAGVAVPTMNSIVSALRFFFTHTLERPDLARRPVRVTHPRKLPVAPSPDEVARLIAFDGAGVTFRYKDYRRSGPQRQQVMTLDAHEFIRRFLLHVLPHGFHRIRHCGLFASATRKANIARVRELLAAPTSSPEPIEAAEPPAQLPPCPCCGGRMRIVETFERRMQPRAPPRRPTATGAPA